MEPSWVTLPGPAGAPGLQLQACPGEQGCSIPAVPCSAGLAPCSQGSQTGLGLCFSAFARGQEFISLRLISPRYHLHLLQGTAEFS